MAKKTGMDPKVQIAPKLKEALLAVHRQELAAIDVSDVGARANALIKQHEASQGEVKSDAPGLTK